VTQAKAAANSGEDRLGKLEQTYAAEMKSLKASQDNASIAIKALTARADELARRSTSNVKEATADSEKDLAKARLDLAAQKAAAAKAKQDADAKLAAANKAAEKAVADARLDADAKLAAANKTAEKAVADARLDAEAKLAEANKAAATARAQAEALKYSEFSSRYALLESKRRSKAISEEDFKAALAGLRKELGL
jgi:hypothetical protein